MLVDDGSNDTSSTQADGENKDQDIKTQNPGNQFDLPFHPSHVCISLTDTMTDTSTNDDNDNDMTASGAGITLLEVPSQTQGKRGPGRPRGRAKQKAASKETP